MGREDLSGVILLTGATGFLGAQITRRIIKDTDHRIITLVRAGETSSADHRMKRAWWDFPELIGALGGRVKALKGDISQQRLGLNDDQYNDLVSSLTHIIHTAADMRLDGPLKELRKTNVIGTRNILELAKDVNDKTKNGLERFSHVSTAYVAGGRKGSVPESSLTDEFGFWSNYEISKYEGEFEVKKAGLPTSVFRPGLVVGDSKTGEIKTFNTIYFPLRLYLTGQLVVLPASKHLKVNLVPVDYISKAVANLTFNPDAEGLNFHLTAPHELLPTAGELIQFIRQWIKTNLGLRIRSPIFLPMPVSLIKKQYRTRTLVERKRKGILNALITLAPYFNERRKFERENIDRLLGPYDFNWREVVPKLIEFGVYTGFFHRSERTVHEQIMFRLGGRSRPVTYYDIVKKKIIKRTTEEIRNDIVTAIKAINKLGIQPSDRIALVGLNSSRYLILDVAIGMAGAVNVPLYYTSPIHEIDEIVKASSAKLLFVGMPEILKNIRKLKNDIQIISFCGIKDSLPNNVISWKEFLAKGKDIGKGVNSPVKNVSAPVGFGDLATIRYTSGTTGKPKGVMFNHAHLRWMAESLISILPWKARNREIRYLSFLPMNHVVEGILSAYSPYYAPAPLNIYFLEDFRELATVLPQVKPSIFFSVPRYYEKVWSILEKTGIGRSYLNSNEGFKKKLYGKLLKRGLLKRTGLDKCEQIIVGSAPISKDLLQGYHDLGIEVHNAYGLTEAPLVTMNLSGSNRIGTVGEPLPKTELKIAEDGEIMVNGPQVTSGYFDDHDKSPVENNWLSTGDIGIVTKDGSLVIEGRKKEIIVTSYAKNIHPLKLEALLRDIPGVSEAMVVGDNRPYCAALLWINDKNKSDKTIDKNVIKVNQCLSHPEQIKCWAVLYNDLSIDGGELTASLKIKRKAIMKRFDDVISALYNKEQTSKDILHLGESSKVVKN